MRGKSYQKTGEHSDILHYVPDLVLSRIINGKPPLLPGTSRSNSRLNGVDTTRSAVPTGLRRKSSVSTTLRSVSEDEGSSTDLDPERDVSSFVPRSYVSWKSRPSTTRCPEETSDNFYGAPSVSDPKTRTDTRRSSCVKGRNRGLPVPAHGGWGSGQIDSGRTNCLPGKRRTRSRLTGRRITFRY